MAATTSTKKQDISFKEVREDMTFAMVNRVSTNKDISVFICYDHRKGPDLNGLVKNLLDDIKMEDKNCFILRVVE